MSLSLKNRSVVTSTTKLPLAMNSMRLAASLANPNSCVTINIVIPEVREFPHHVQHLDRTISGSRAEVGSSNSIACGFMARALAIATRCSLAARQMIRIFFDLFNNTHALEKCFSQLISSVFRENMGSTLLTTAIQLHFAKKCQANSIAEFDRACLSEYGVPLEPLSWVTI